MRHKFFIRWLFIISVSLLLTACWDERLLKDHSLILAVGYDKANGEELINTIAFPIKEGGAGGEGGETPLQKSKVLSVKGHTAKEAEKHMDQSIPEKFDRSKAKVIIFGKEVAEEGIFPILDSVYRDLRGSLNAKVVIFDGKAKDALSIQKEGAILTSELYAELLNSAAKAGITKNDNVQALCPIVLGEGKDIILPYVGLMDETNEPDVKGVALFVDDKMTATLNLEETSTLLMLMDQIAKNLTLNLKISDDHEKDSVKNFINIAIRQNKRKLKVEQDHGKVQVKVDVRLNVEIDEFAEDHLYDIKKVKKISNKIEKRLNQVAKNTIEQVQAANSDVLGIGQKVKAYHHDVWEKTDWKKEYSNIPIEARFKVEVTRHGITN